MPVSYSLTLSSLRDRLRSGQLSPAQLAHDVLAAAAEGDRYHAWIHRLPEPAVLAQAQRLESDAAARSLPLYAMPFAIKDNIDAADYPTTAGCPAYSYIATTTATAVQRLMDAGAILIGKTNLDQFATGLVGTRSPYGACANAFDPRYISGGSSSRSAVAVALIPAPLAIGTLELEDKRGVQGFLCESHAVADARDISAFGGWRNFIASLEKLEPAAHRLGADAARCARFGSGGKAICGRHGT